MNTAVESLKVRMSKPAGQVGEVEQRLLGRGELHAGPRLLEATEYLGDDVVDRELALPCLDAASAPEGHHVHCP